ncbi:hypothetical protein D9758_015289 [Tetrapyrgos nigripes]|uniref:Heterokaryon incompatibility domain-containing protein n=1 Tax=Tetrapyrgos nigripes TaxID=182062 RepID=A0A8H5CMY3_9AGAR|nr:hypothetical protein D9758_015289 [Tetrapyrgos nigripes]
MACHQALRDGLEYVWVDTCCVTQGNHNDVVRNIRSMFAYYRNGYVCYVHLADVYLRDDMWRSRFAHSEWFRRGWTLQELLAPGVVDFFDSEWNYVGSKLDLQDIVSHITTKPPEIISGEQSLQDIHPLKRMSWALGRQTSRPQDRAYCLSGLLNVSIEPDYTEDLRQSMNRLWAAFLHSNSKYKHEIGVEFSLFDFVDSIRDGTQLIALDTLKRAGSTSRGRRAQQLDERLFIFYDRDDNGSIISYTQLPPGSPAYQDVVPARGIPSSSSLFDFVDSIRDETQLIALDTQTHAIQFLDNPKRAGSTSRGQGAQQFYGWDDNISYNELPRMAQSRKPAVWQDITKESLSERIRILVVGKVPS